MAKEKSTRVCSNPVSEDFAIRLIERHVWKQTSGNILLTNQARGGKKKG